jgi:nicotinamidase/pyrazinamidase
MKVKPTDCLVAVDIQIDFMQNGALPVPGADYNFICDIHHLAKRFANVILTQDWHPPNHQSFACNHEGTEPFDTVILPYGKQTLWPKHCVWGTGGADFALSLVTTTRARAIIRKGMNPEIDSYSAFMENDRKTSTGLDGLLSSLDIRRVFFCGLAGDVCVIASAEDATRFRTVETFIVTDACRFLDKGTSDQLSFAERAQAHNIKLLTLEDFG